MSEPTNDPPLVTRPEPEEWPTPPAPKLPAPGFFGAVLWCGVFVAVQMLGAVVGMALVFTAYALAAPQPGKFVEEQFAGIGKAVEPGAPDAERPAVPFEIGQALAWGMLAAQFAALALIALVIPRRVGPDWKRQLGVRRPHGLHVLLVLLLVPGFIVCSDLIQTLFLSATGIKPPAAVKALNGVFGQYPWPLTVLAVAVGPGLVEEFWCRGFLGRGLCSRYGIAAGVLVTSVLFSAMHLDWSQLLVIAVMGAFLHFVYFATRSIWAPILLHASNNALAILLALTLKQGEIVVPAIVHIVAFGLMVFGSVALWTSRAELEPLQREEAGGGARGNPRGVPPEEEWWEEGSWQPEYPGISAPPADANVRLAHATVSPVAVLSAVTCFGVMMYLAFQFAR